MSVGKEEMRLNLLAKASMRGLGNRILDKLRNLELIAGAIGTIENSKS